MPKGISEEPITIGDGSLTITWRDADWTTPPGAKHRVKPDSGKTVKRLELNQEEIDGQLAGQSFALDVTYEEGTTRRILRASTPTGKNLEIHALEGNVEHDFDGHFNLVRGTTKAHYASKLNDSAILAASYRKGGAPPIPLKLAARKKNAITVYYDV